MVKAATKVTNFADILDIPSKDVTRPRPLPQGWYHIRVKGQYRQDNSTKKGTEFSEYTLQFVRAMEDVDEDALTEALTSDSGEQAKLSDKTIRYTFYHTIDSRSRLKKWLNDLGIPEVSEDGEDMSIRERMQFVPNCEALIHIKHTPSDDGEMMWANVDRSRKIDED